MLEECGTVTDKHESPGFDSQHHKHTHTKSSWVWWCSPVIPSVGRQRQEDPYKFQAGVPSQICLSIQAQGLFNTSEHTLLSQRTHIQFLLPMSDGSQPFVTPAPGDSKPAEPFQVSVLTSEYPRTDRQTDRLAQAHTYNLKKNRIRGWVCAYNLSTLEAEAGFEFKASLGSTVRYSVGYILRPCLKRTKYKPIRRKKKKKEKKMETTLVQICFHPTKRSILWNNHVASTQEIGKPVKQEGQPGLAKKPCLKNRNKKIKTHGVKWWGNDISFLR